MRKIKLAILKWVLSWFVSVKGLPSSFILEVIDELRVKILQREGAYENAFRIPQGIDVITEDKDLNLWAFDLVAGYGYTKERGMDINGVLRVYRHFPSRSVVERAYKSSITIRDFMLLARREWEDELD